MKINADLTTTFDSDTEAMEYGRAVRATMLTPMHLVPRERWELIRGWSLQVEAAVRGVDKLDSGGMLFMATVAPGRILLAVIDHFGGLDALSRLASPPSDI